MTATLLPSEMALQPGASSERLVALHFARSQVPHHSALSDAKHSIVPCSPLFYDATSYHNSLYVRSWSMTGGIMSPGQVSPARSRSRRPPSNLEGMVASSALPTAHRKPPLAPYPPRGRSSEDSQSSSAITCNSCWRSPRSSCPPSSHAATDPASPNSRSNLQSLSASDLEAGSACQSSVDPDSHALDSHHQEAESMKLQEHAGSAPSIPNEMGSRSVFLANMSHELRTPLNGTVAVVELLLSTKVSPEQRDLLKTVLESSHSLTRILSTLLIGL